MEDAANIDDEFLGTEELPIPVDGVEGEGDPNEGLGGQEAPSDHQNGEKERDRERSRSRRDRRRSRSPHRSRSRSRDRDRQRKRFVTVNSTRVVVKNMPYELKWQDIKDLFRKEVGDVAYVEMIEGHDGKPRGIAVLEFKDKDAARKAIESMHQYKIHDRYLVVHEERDKDRRLFQSVNRDMGGGMDGRGMDGRGGGGMGDMRGVMGPGGLGLGGGGLGLGLGGMGGAMMNMSSPGISPDVLAQLGIDGPISPQVFVANLDYKVTNHKLKEVFRLAGNVTKAEIKEDKTGKSRGMGVVQFEQPLEAVQAISMFNNQSLYDRRMIVRMDRVPEDITPPNKLPSGLKSIGMGLGLGGSPLTNLTHLSSPSGLGMGSGLGGAGLGAAGLAGGLGAGLGLGMEAGLGVGGLGVTGLSGIAGLGSASSLGVSGLGGIGAGLGKLGSLEGHHHGMGLDSGMMGSGGGGLGYGGSSGGDHRAGGRGRDERGQRFTRPDNCTVQVKNLPYAVTWQDLRERFLEIGEVKYAEIKTEKGRSTGVGLVRFSSEDDAVRAINSMDRTRFEGRTIDVQMYRG